MQEELRAVLFLPHPCGFHGILVIDTPSAMARSAQKGSCQERASTYLCKVAHFLLPWSCSPLSIGSSSRERFVRGETLPVPSLAILRAHEASFLELVLQSVTLETESTYGHFRAARLKLLKGGAALFHCQDQELSTQQTQMHRTMAGGNGLLYRGLHEMQCL